MPLLYPIAANAREALDAEGGVRTVGEARELAKGPVSLVSDWLRPSPAERQEVQAKAEAGVSRGFVQLYEDAKGQPVIAVSYWKLDSKTPAMARKAKGKAEKAAAPAEDHTDDLYFTKPGAKAKKKPKVKSLDPNQLDLFGPDQKGAEHADPHNPGVVIVDEEGDGASFGGVDQAS
jgi:hypothetical protein